MTHRIEVVASGSCNVVGLGNIEFTITVFQHSQFCGIVTDTTKVDAFDNLEASPLSLILSIVLEDLVFLAIGFKNSHNS
jgi:hypothetical protein